MEKMDEFTTVIDSTIEPTAEAPPKPARRPFTPREPMTAEEHEAMLELIAMMQITPDELSEKRYRELHKLWA